MKHTIIILLFIAGLSVGASSDTNMNSPDTTPITGFELDRYLGTWYEIARFPNSFEKNLVGVTANYSMKDNGKVKVVNAGYKNSLDGEYTAAIGKAKFAGNPNTGQLKVSFFLFFYGDYHILKLDKEHYRYALVGGSTSKYLWILARESELDEEIYNDLLKEAETRGYDLSLLEKVPQQPINKMDR
jgi:lipocalin